MNIIKTLAKTAACAAVLGLGIYGARIALAPDYTGGAGIASGKAFAPIRDKDVSFHIWYPAGVGGREVTVGGNGVFYGTPGGRNAPHLPGAFPMIVISHGSGGNAGQFGWIAAALAKAGYVVVLPNHPGTTSGDASVAAALRLWERPGDVTAVIDYIAAHPGDFDYVDMGRIGALGFSAGGYTAMALSGARADPAVLNGFCDLGGQGMSDCDFLTQSGVDLHSFDFTPAAQDLRDPRIGAAVVIDPGTVQAITPASLAAIDIPMLLVNLGTDAPAPVEASEAAAMIAGARYAVVDGATHFSFLAECKAAGAAILAREGEADLLCSDGGTRERGDIHAELVGMIVDYLDGVRWGGAAR